MNRDISPEDIARRLQDAAAKAKESFALAFLEETRLLPSDAVMKYGLGKDELGNHIFKVWFERKTPEETDAPIRHELAAAKGLLDQISFEVGKKDDETLLDAIHRRLMASCGCADRETRGPCGSLAP